MTSSSEGSRTGEGKLSVGGGNLSNILMFKSVLLNLFWIFCYSFRLFEYGVFYKENTIITYSSESSLQIWKCTSNVQSTWWWSMARVMSFPPDVTLATQAKDFNLCFVRLENFVSNVLRFLWVSFSKLQVGCHVPFSDKCFLLGHSTMLEESCRDVVFLEGSPLSMEKHWRTLRVTISTTLYC